MQTKHITQDPNLNTDHTHSQQTPQPATTKSTQTHTQTLKTACSGELERKNKMQLHQKYLEIPNRQKFPRSLVINEAKNQVSKTAHRKSM